MLHENRILKNTFPSDDLKDAINSRSKPILGIAFLVSQSDYQSIVSIFAIYSEKMHTYPEILGKTRYKNINSCPILLLYIRYV